MQSTRSAVNLSGSSSTPDFSKGVESILSRMCDVAAGELLRMLSIVGHGGIREEMLYPSLLAAGASSTSSVLAERRDDGKARGSKRTGAAEKGAPKRVDLVLFHRGEVAKQQAVMIEVKISPTTKQKIQIDSDQIDRTCKAKPPKSVNAAKVGSVLLAVMRVALGDIGKGGLDEDKKLCRARLPAELEDKQFIAFARFHGQSCRTFAVVLRLDSDSKPNKVKNAAK